MVMNEGVKDEINDEDLTLEPIIVPLKTNIALSPIQLQLDIFLFGFKLENINYFSM